MPCLPKRLTKSPSTKGSPFRHSSSEPKVTTSVAAACTSLVLQMGSSSEVAQRCCAGSLHRAWHWGYHLPKTAADVCCCALTRVGQSSAPQGDPPNSRMPVNFFLLQSRSTTNRLTRQNPWRCRRRQNKLIEDLLWCAVERQNHQLGL